MRSGPHGTERGATSPAAHLAGHSPQRPQIPTHLTGPHKAGGAADLTVASPRGPQLATRARWRHFFRTMLALQCPHRRASQTRPSGSASMIVSLINIRHRVFILIHVHAQRMALRRYPRDVSVRRVCGAANLFTRQRSAVLRRRASPFTTSVPSRRRLTPQSPFQYMMCPPRALLRAPLSLPPIPATLHPLHPYAGAPASPYDGPAPTATRSMLTSAVLSACFGRPRARPHRGACADGVAAWNAWRPCLPPSSLTL